jgi:glycosyltransferase involved in cell wall biosynthesis
VAATPADRPFLSVIVPVFDDRIGLCRCLEALDRQTMPKDRFEVIVVDNGSHQPMTPLVDQFPFARCVIEPKNGSYAARNRGAQHATGAVLAFTDADCQPLPDWLMQTARVFELEARVSAIGGRIDLVVSHERALAELYEMVLSPFPQESFVEKQGFAATANLAVRASVFEAVGPFNEGLLSSGDREWGNRLIASGYELRYAPQCAVEHPARRTIRSLVNKRRRIEGGTVRLARSGGFAETNRGTSRLHPSRTELAFALLFRPEAFGLGRLEALKVLALSGYLVAVRLIEGLRIRLGWRPIR